MMDHEVVVVENDTVAWGLQSEEDTTSRDTTICCDAHQGQIILRQEEFSSSIVGLNGRTRRTLRTGAAGVALSTRISEVELDIRRGGSFVHAVIVRDVVVWGDHPGTAITATTARALDVSTHSL